MSHCKATLSANTKRAIAKYGEEKCRKAFELYESGEYGASNIAFLLGLKTVLQGDAAINAGRELNEKEKQND